MGNSKSKTGNDLRRKPSSFNGRFGKRRSSSLPKPDPNAYIDETYLISIFDACDADQNGEVSLLELKRKCVQMVIL